MLSFIELEMFVLIFAVRLLLNHNFLKDDKISLWSNKDIKKI